ncbi:MAG: hypothetical protein ACOZNI_27750 [Myxococcota bacterium]
MRRLDVPEAPFAVRFEVRGGKGILRVARPGVLIDPPARAAGVEERLTAPQLRASRFLHVRDGGRERKAHALSRCDEASLDTLPAGEWIELEAAVDGPNAFLELPKGVRSGEETGDEYTPISQKLILRDFQRDLRQLVERARPSQGDDDDPIEAGSETGEAPLPTPKPAAVHAAPPPAERPTLQGTSTWSQLVNAPPTDRPTLPGTSTWPVRPTTPTTRAHPAPKATPPAPPPKAEPPPKAQPYVPTKGTVPLDAGVFEEGEDVPTPRHVARPTLPARGAEPRAESVAKVEPAPKAEPPKPAPVAPAEPAEPARATPPERKADALAPEQWVHARTTTLVRAFRRRHQRDRVRILELEARVRELEARIRSGGG